MHTSMESQPTTTGVGWRRVRFTLAASVVLGGLLSLPMETATYIVVIRGIVVGMSAMLAFSLFEKWPRAEPRRIPRWVLQLLGIVVIVPVAAWFAYWLTTGGHPRFDQEEKRVVGYMMLTFTGAFFGPWIALGAMLRQRDAFARTQALAFDLERSELERKAVDARLRLLQAQVEPHFLFDTASQCPRSSMRVRHSFAGVLASLIAYLVPRFTLNEDRRRRWARRSSRCTPTSRSCRCACRTDCTSPSASTRWPRVCNVPP